MVTSYIVKGKNRNRFCLSSDMWNLVRYLESSEFLFRYYTISRVAPFGDAAVDERRKASALVACYIYVKRHISLRNTTEVQTTDSTGVRNKDTRGKVQETGNKG